MSLATSRIGDQFMNRCNTPTLGTGSPSVFVNGLANGTIGKQTIPYQETVPCPTCCKTYVAKVIKGSPKVFVNGLASARLSDIALGITGTFPIIKASPSVFMS
jgi:uncharacterized Zn-binding protein involved in type VI secretion